MADPFFAVKGLCKHFQGVKAVDGIDLCMEQGEIRGVIGPNGAGKTTFFNLITGMTEPDSGEIWFRGRRVENLAPHAVCSLGISRTFQHTMLFSQMTVAENVMVGQHSRTPTLLLSILAGGSKSRQVEAKSRRVAADELAFVGLQDRCDEIAANLSYGEQRLVEIARALATQPSLLLLDEPAAGMNPAEKAGLVKLIQEIRSRGVTVIAIEHDMKVIMNVCDRISVLDFGRKIAEGTPMEVKSNPRVLEAYLGREEHDLAH